MRNISKLILSVVVVVLIASGIYLAKSQGPKASSTTFNIGTNSWVGFGPMYLAKDKGFFKDAGLDVNISVMEDQGQRTSAMVKGDIDAYIDTVDLLVQTRANNVPSKAVMQVDLSTGADGIVTTDNIKTVADLKGKKIAAQKNFVGESFLMYVLKKNGMSVNDVEIIDTESAAAGSAFVSGKVDAAVTFEPWLSKAKERQGGHVLVSSADEPGVVVDILSVNEKYLKDHPDNVKKVMQAWFKAVDYWKAHPDEANQIMANDYKLKPAEFADFISGLKWPSYEENLAYFGTKDNPGKIYDVAQIFSQAFLESGSIKSAPDMKAAIDDSLLRGLR